MLTARTIRYLFEMESLCASSQPSMLSFLTQLITAPLHSPCPPHNSNNDTRWLYIRLQPETNDLFCKRVLVVEFHGLRAT